MKAKFTFEPVPAGLPPEAVVIRELPAPATVAEDAEAVVQTLFRVLRQLNEPEFTPMYYYRQDEVLVQLIHDGVEWKGFAPVSPPAASPEAEPV